MQIARYIILLTGLLTAIGCGQFQNSTDNSKLLASAYGNQLYFEEVEDHLTEFHTKLDSEEIISRYIDNWLMEKILSHEARKKTNNRNAIKALVEDYESSLYIHQLEEDYINNELNTSVDSSEIASYFKVQRDAFLPEGDIIRYLLIVVPEDFDNDTLQTLWKTEDLPVLQQYISDVEGLMILDPDEWYTPSDIESVIPENLFKKINFKTPDNYSYTQDDKKYYVKILEIVKESETPPVSYYHDKIRELILRSRSQTLIKEMKNNIFKEKIKSKNIKIFHSENN